MPSRWSQGRVLLQGFHRCDVVPQRATIVGWIEGNTTRFAHLLGIFTGVANCAPIIGYPSADWLKKPGKAAGEWNSVTG